VRDLGQPFAFDDIDRKLEDILTRLRQQLAAGATAQKETDPGTHWDPTKVDKFGSTTINVVEAPYTVSGTWLEVIDKLEKRGEAGSVLPVFGAEYVDLNSAGKIVRAHLIIDEVLAMPTWPELDKQCDPVQAEWRRFETALGTHEQGHIAIDQKWFSNLHRKMIGHDPNDAVLDKNAAVASADSENIAYDGRTQHGVNQASGVTTRIDPVQCGPQKVRSGGT